MDYTTNYYQNNYKNDFNITIININIEKNYISNNYIYNNINKKKQNLILLLLFGIINIKNTILVLNILIIFLISYFNKDSLFLLNN